MYVCLADQCYIFCIYIVYMCLGILGGCMCVVCGDRDSRWRADHGVLLLGCVSAHLDGGYHDSDLPM